MKTLELVQGSPDWHAHRKSHRNASDAPAMMSAGKYQTRSALLHAIATGYTPDIDPNTQRLFDRGHAAEAAIRPHVEKLVGDDLYPATGVSDDYPLLSASFDGITMDESIVFEHKLLNAELFRAVTNGDELDPHYYWQLEQQLIVSGAEKAIFVVSDGTPENMAHCWYVSKPERRAALLAGWEQFEKDLAAYVPEEKPLPVVAAPVMDLPAVNVQIAGTLEVLSNLPAWGNQLRDFIGGLNPKPESDQDFADAENEIKVLKRAEDELEAAEDRALAQISVVDEMRRTKAMLHKLARDTRLAREKLVKDRKELVRREIQKSAEDLIAKHMLEHGQRWGRQHLPAIQYDVAGAMKGKKTVASLKDAAASEVARAKIEADRVAKVIDANLETLRTKAGEHKFLFSDVSALVLKDPEAVSAIVDQRITAHEAEQKRKAEEAAERERERIRQEEQAKAQREAQAKADAERRAREAEEAARITAEVQARQKEARSIERAAEDFGGTGKVAVAESAPAPAEVVAIAKEPVRPKDQYVMPGTLTIVSAVAAEFGVPPHIAAGWLRSLNQAELAQVAA